MNPTERTTRFAALFLILTVSALQGCRTARQVAARYPRSDIESIYAGSVANPDRNPVVLVHGFAGSTLQRTVDDATVWGAFFTRNSLLPSRQPGLTAFALDIDALYPPIDPGELVSIEDDTRAVALLEKVRADAGPVEINVGIYAELVELIESSGYSTCESDPTAISSLENPPCLTFFYDWRQDIVGSSMRLGEFLATARNHLGALDPEDEERGGDPVRFDLIAHSMGGLVARYFLRYGDRDVLSEDSPDVDWGGADLLDRLIAISTPNFGSMKVLREMVFGRHHPVVDFEPAMIATWVSPYQMLPRAHHALWLDRGGEPVGVDILATDVWRRNEWGPFAPDQDKFLRWLFPDESTAAGRQERIAGFMATAFERARRFQAVMDSPPGSDCPTELTLFAADVQPTMARAVVVEKSGKASFRFDGAKGVELKSPGDGSVTRASAVGDERLGGTGSGPITSPIPWDRQIFLTDMHRTFLGNPTFQNNLLHILLETTSRRAGRI